ncbi:hypothetical protein HISP_01285 [Haloarcula hispanica N601]|uniref:DUF1102 domain-containing protein n=2 Tax=Haloarcula hispanica TaxID=51589 RepID=V5TJL9_HALHI|nr:hypothetical protein [Haloarcula hispanica]AEM55868.1 conserved hypothetical protein [Haloarcula hispanica ATCC 33960]AHB64694.1 hypothetical protein HISP_01285 [Haloarcula hispanica N601]
MKLNRRSVLGLIGTVGIGSGAAFGSGAFSTVSATREVEVNVVGADGNGSEIATEFTDVLVDASADEVALRNSNDDLVTDATTLFPKSSDSLTTDGATTVSTDYVSLIANDVSVVFGYEDGGTDERLMPNSTYDYESGFFKLVNNDDGNSTAFNVELSTGSGLLSDINGSGDTHSEEVSAGGVSDLSATLETGDSAQETEDLTITITEV